VENSRALGLAQGQIASEEGRGGVGWRAMKILYKPFAIIASAIAARLGRSVFKTIWAKIDSAAPPEPTTQQASLPKVVGAAALEAATMAGVGAAVDRASARTFEHLTGFWPGKRQQEPEEDA
jgi:Protein of unknown function (DUF4235)